LSKVLFAIAVLLAAQGAAAIAPQVLTARRSVPAELAGRFRDPRGFQQSASGQYFVFDRRGHTVYGLDEHLSSIWRIVEIGAEPGRIIEPTAFSVAADGTFVVADAPRGLGRVQVFTPAGFQITGFTLSARARPRVVFDDIVMNGIGSVHYTGASVLLSQPEYGALVTEYTLSGQTSRTFGALRATGQEGDLDVHLALNSGIPLRTPEGGFFFVFQAGFPVFQKYDRAGRLLFERQMQGLEIDSIVAELPVSWPRNAAGHELPLVAPTIRAAAVDPAGNLWVSFARPFTYVFDPDGDKIRTIQFSGVGIVSPRSLFFGPKGGLLVTPGLAEFETQSARR